MAKKRLKQKEIEAEQFDATKPPSQWPARVQVNDHSYTGYSYGSLELFENEPGAPLTRDGFEINNTDWIIIDDQNLVTKMTNIRMQAEYED